METHHTIDLKFRFWLENKEGESLLGNGRLQLLENIKKTGSITNAAKEMNMSYRKAWELVQKMNKNSPIPLVEKIIGGNKGSGAVLTPEADRIIKKYYQIEKELEDFISLHYSEIKF